MQVTQGVLLSPSRSTLRHRREIVRVNSKTLPLALNHSLGRRLIVTQWLLAHRVRNLGHPPTATKVMCLFACCVSVDGRVEYQDQAERIDLIFFLTGPGPSPKSTGPSARSSSPALSPRGVAKPPWSLLQRCSSRFRLITTATAPFYLGRGRHSVTHAPIHRCGGSDQSLTDSTMNYSPLSLQSACARH